MNQIFSTTHDQCVLMDVHAILLGGAQSVELSTAERQPLPRTIGTGQEFDLKLHFPLDTRRAVEIEKLRQTDVLISFSISPILAGIEIMAAKKDGANIGRTCHFLTANFEGPNATLSINIPQSHWVRNILPHLNVAEYLLIEVPSKTSKKLLSAWQHVEKAEASYLNRDMKGAFAYCREAGDAIDTTLQQELGENSFAFAERWGRSHKLFSNLSSLYLHIEEKKGKYEPDTVTLEKADLENVLFIAKSLVRFAEHLLATSTKQIPSKPNN
ncbi:MAG TPA: hypothetical protein VNK24_01455 [Elusimicrobiota bacterium]|nr:hypothetical protein [Elusimicrobiota bacterium]